MKIDVKSQAFESYIAMCMVDNEYAVAAPPIRLIGLVNKAVQSHD